MQSLDVNKPLPDAAPMTLATTFLNVNGKDDGELTVRFWQGEFYQWRKGAFVVIPGDELQARVWTFANGQKYRCPRSGKTARFVPTSAKVADIMAAMQAVSQAYDVRQMPAWLDTARAQDHRYHCVPQRPPGCPPIHRRRPLPVTTADPTVVLLLGTALQLRWASSL